MIMKALYLCRAYFRPLFNGYLFHALDAFFNLYLEYLWSGSRALSFKKILPSSLRLNMTGFGLTEIGFQRS